MKADVGSGKTSTNSGVRFDNLSCSGIVLVIGVPTEKTDSLLRVLTDLPTQAVLAIVLAVQHPEAFDEDGFRQALGTRADKLVVVVDGVLLEAGYIYLPSPGLVVTVQAGRFRTQLAEKAAKERGTIDSLFGSISADHNGHTIGVVLAGTGGDGTLGLAMIKEGGGFTLVETPDEVEPLTHASSNGTVLTADFMLPAAAMPEQIMLLARQLAAMQKELAGEVPVGATDNGVLDRIAAVLLQRTGHDFHGYKRPTFMRRVQRRMGVMGANSIEDYFGFLNSQLDEASNLFNDLLIGVTRFFRDPFEFEFLQREVIPRLFEGKKLDEQVRVWVLGCASGEEVYSVAILLREHAARLSSPPGVQIFATDLDGRALVAARLGRYPASIEADISPARLARWFTKEGSTYLVTRELRDACVFSQHSLVKDTPFSRLDLVSCRNVLIYIGPELQDQVFPLFHFALNVGGYLFLGASEGIARHGRLFAPVERGVHIFRKLDSGRRVLPNFPPTSNISLTESGAPRPRSGHIDPAVMRRAERLAERHAPAYAVVDASFDVLKFSARAGQYIYPAGGTASLNLLDLAHADLRLPLRAALGEAKREHHMTIASGILVDKDGQRSVIDIVVEPVRDHDNEPRSFVVLFKDALLPPGLTGGAKENSPVPGASGDQVQWLEAELYTTRDRLRTMAEQMESTNEELKSSNEEYQSLNEELQSANEELATSKEELQSLNEELTTVNQELAHRVEELSRANSDLKNFQQATRIATLFLDRELRVTNFTTAAAAVLHLVETDFGRLIGHIKSRVIYDGLQEDAKEVLDTLIPLEREVEEPGVGSRYMVRVLPYRDIDNMIAGVVVTFTDITQLVQAQQRMQDSEARLRLVIERIPQFIWTAVGSGSWNWIGPQWADYTGQSSDSSRELGWMEAIHPEDLEKAKAAWMDAAEAGELDVEYRVRSKGGIFRWFRIRATPFARKSSEGEMEWFGTGTDIHAMRQLQGRQAVLVAELQHRTRNLIAVIGNVARRSIDPSPGRDEYEARLACLGRVQSFLSRSTAYSVPLADVVDAELQAAGHGASEKFEAGGPLVGLPGESVQAVALALHELATNAVKYGAIAQSSGRLSVTWRIENSTDETNRRLIIEWREKGLAMPKAAPTRTGYGTELITKALPYQLGAETALVFTSDGVQCQIILPARAFISGASNEVV